MNNIKKHYYYQMLKSKMKKEKKTCSKNKVVLFKDIYYIKIKNWTHDYILEMKQFIIENKWLGSYEYCGRLAPKYRC